LASIPSSRWGFSRHRKNTLGYIVYLSFFMMGGARRFAIGSHLFDWRVHIDRIVLIFNTFWPNSTYR
jgi:hypothetical protein